MMGAWTDHVEKWKDCQGCALAQQRSRICLARGVVPCDVLLVGEAPGASEDAIGEPFRGPAGRLLDEIVERALSAWQAPGTTGPDYNSVTYAMTNLVACFPQEAKARGDNEPERCEILACAGRLAEFVNLAQPRLIVCVGHLAQIYVDHNDTVKCADIVHPAHILRKEVPLAKKQSMILHATVVLRNAVMDMLQRGRTEWKQWGARRASVKAYDDSEIPF